jgi:hypothetical protein
MFSLSSCLFVWKMSFCLPLFQSCPVSLAFACHIIVSYLWQPPTIQLKFASGYTRCCLDWTLYLQLGPNYQWCISCNSYQPLVVNHTLVISPIALMMIGTGFGYSRKYFFFTASRKYKTYVRYLRDIVLSYFKFLSQTKDKPLSFLLFVSYDLPL